MLEQRVNIPTLVLCAEDSEIPQIGGEVNERYVPEILRRGIYDDSGLNKTPPIAKVTFTDEKETIVSWADGTQTSAKCGPDDTYDSKIGFSICVAKKYFGSTGEFKKNMNRWCQ